MRRTPFCGCVTCRIRRLFQARVARNRGRAMRTGRLEGRLLAAGAAGIALAILSACGQDNRYVAPPPPKVRVALPLQQPVTRYLEATGYTAAVNTANLAPP